MSTLFERVVEASGLSSMFAARTIERAAKRAGIAHPRELSKSDLTRALVAIEESLRMYLEPDETRHRLELITRLVHAKEDTTPSASSA